MAAPVKKTALGTQHGPASEDTFATDVPPELETILASEIFARSDRMSRFLRYIVEQALAGKQAELKEQTIAMEVFDKPPSFDTRLDPIVRVEARRLRSKLLDYYDKLGRPAKVVIKLDRRGYVPRFEPASGAAATPDASGTPEKPKSGGLRPGVGAQSAVAVLPFLDLSANKELEHFCDGLTDEVINALTQVQGLQVVSRSSSFQFKGPAHDVREVGEQLGVGVVMEGSVRLAEDRVRITVQLNDANDGFHLWSEIYEGNLSDEFKVQEDISNQIVKTLEGHKAGPFNYELTKKHTSSGIAYQHYLQGLYHKHSTSPHNLARGIECFEAAIEADPNYARAYAGLASCWCKLAWLEVSPPFEAWPRAKQAATKCLEIDETDSTALAAIGAARCAGEWSWAEGEKALLQAIEGDPCDPGAHQWYAVTFLAPHKRIEEAKTALERAVEMGPRSLYAHNHIGLLHLYGGEYQEAIERHRRVLAIKGDFVPALWDIGRAYEQVSMLAEAENAFRRGLELSGGRSLLLASLGHCYALQGKTKEALKIASDLVKLADETYVAPLDVVRVYAGLRDRDQAFEWLEKALEDHCSRLIELDLDPVFAPLREDRRMEAALRTIGLPT